MTLSTPYERALERIDRTPELEPYRELIMDDWPEGDPHYEWVATCDLAELLSWVEETGSE